MRFTGPLGQIESADRYRDSLAQIFRTTRELVLDKRWVDGRDVITWFDTRPRSAAEPFPLASRLHIRNGRIQHVRVTFDLSGLLEEGELRRAPSVGAGGGLFHGRGASNGSEVR